MNQKAAFPSPIIPLKTGADDGFLFSDKNPSSAGKKTNFCSETMFWPIKHA
jgi:hypothetical protein